MLTSRRDFVAEKGKHFLVEQTFVWFPYFISDNTAPSAVLSQGLGLGWEWELCSFLLCSNRWQLGGGRATISPLHHAFTVPQLGSASTEGLLISWDVLVNLLALLLGLWQTSQCMPQGMGEALSCWYLSSIMQAALLLHGLYLIYWDVYAFLSRAKALYCHSMGIRLNLFPYPWPSWKKWPAHLNIWM